MSYFLIWAVSLLNFNLIIKILTFKSNEILSSNNIKKNINFFL